MGFFSDIVRDSQRPPPAVKSGPHGTDLHSGREVNAGRLAESRPLGLEAVSQPLLIDSHEASRPENGEQDTRPKVDAPAKAPPLVSITRRAMEPSPATPTRETGLAQAQDRIKTRTLPVSGRQTDRTSRRPGAVQPAKDQAGTSNEVVSTAGEHKDSQDAVVGTLLAQDHGQGEDETSREQPESRPAGKIARAETPDPPIQTPQNLRHPSISLPPILSSPTADKDGSVSTKPAPDANQDDFFSHAEAKPHPIESTAMPPPRRANRPPSAPDPLPPTAQSDAVGRPPVAAIPVPLEQVPSDTLPEGGGDKGPPPEFRVLAARPAAPGRIETPAALAPVRNQEEGRAAQIPSQPVPTPKAAPESPKVQIGLLEVVVLAPENPPQGAHPAHKARTNIASRHYLRNL